MDQQMIGQAFAAGRMVDALTYIGVIITIWLALRVANMTGENPNSNLFTKLLSTAFGLSVMAGTWISFTFAANTFVAAARRMQEFGVDNDYNPERAQAFIDYVGTTETVSTPTPLGIAFIVILTVMILGLIWGPRK